MMMVLLLEFSFQTVAKMGSLTKMVLYIFKQEQN